MDIREARPIRGGLWVFPLTLAFLLSGCVNGVSWLPDSSGFFFTTSKGQIVLFDVKTRKRTVVAADTKSNTYWPALDPEGKHIAVARLTFEDKKVGKLEVVLYDRDGRETHRSPSFSWGMLDNGKPEAYNAMTELFWSPDGSKILVYGSVHGPYGTTGIYDLATKRMEQLPQSVPARFGTSPIRPDGKGFLLARLRRGGEELEGLAFVAWDGKEKPIDMKFDANRAEKEGPALGPLLAHPLLRWSKWEKEVAVLTSGTSQVRIDTAKEIATLHVLDRAKVTIGGQFIWQQHTFPGGACLSVLTPTEGKASYKEFTAEYSDPKGAKARTVITRGNERLLSLFPSPDGKHVVLRVWEGDRVGPDADRIFLVDQGGKTLEIDVNE